jgi:hypothetical protein
MFCVRAEIISLQSERGLVHSVYRVFFGRIVSRVHAIDFERPTPFACVMLSSSEIAKSRVFVGMKT